MVWTVLITAVVAGTGMAIIAYKKGYKNGYKKAFLMSLDLC